VGVTRTQGLRGEGIQGPLGNYPVFADWAVSRAIVSQRQCTEKAVEGYRILGYGERDKRLRNGRQPSAREMTLRKKLPVNTQKGSDALSAKVRKEGKTVGGGTHHKRALKRIKPGSWGG